jgi:hypothetical protein
MALSKLEKTLGAGAIALSALFATPAMALDAGKCYPAQEVIDATWNAKGSDQQFNIVVGDEVGGKPIKSYLTSNLSGNLGYNIAQLEGSDKLCIGKKYTDIKVNTNPDLSRPDWLKVPANSKNGRWMDYQATNYQQKVLFVATDIIRRPSDGVEVLGRDLIVVRSQGVEGGGQFGGSMVTNNPHTGDGDRILSMNNLQHGRNFQALVELQRRVEVAQNQAGQPVLVTSNEPRP